MASHYTAMDYDDRPKYKNETYSLLMATHSGITQLLTKYFPDTIILPMIGNNDNMYHDNPEPSYNDHFFYDYLFNLWFHLLPGNQSQLP